MALNPIMDYGSLLQLAKKTSDRKKETKRSFPSMGPVRTSTEQKNAELEKKKLLDENVARFLAKREQEEKKRRKEANVKREGLLAIRNQDSKARKRVKIMNKSAKSADKSAIEDAVGPSDYYVIEEPLCFMSQESLAQEEKFLEKLCKVPEEEKFSKAKKNLNKDLSGTKDRVKLALQLGDFPEKKEKTRESKDKTKDHNLKDKFKGNSYKSEREEPTVDEKPKKSRQPRPPPMNYLELLKLAEKLQQEPVQELPKEKEPEMRPMTSKERELYLLEEASRKRKEEGWKVDKQPKNLNKMPSSVQSQGSRNISSATREERSMSSIPRIPKVKDRPNNTEKRSGSSDDRTEKLSREDKYGDFRPTEKHSVPKEDFSSSSKQTRPLENSNRAKQNSNYQRNSIEQGPKENTGKFTKEGKRLMKNESEKPQQTGHKREQPGSSKLSSQQHRKPSQISADTKEVKSSNYKSLKPSLPQQIVSKPMLSATDSKQNLRNLPPSDKTRHPGSLDMKSRSQSMDLPNSKPKDLQPPIVKSKTLSTNIKSRPAASSISAPKQNVSNVKTRPLPISNSKPKQQTADKKSKPLPTLDPKLRHSIDTSKSRPLPPSDSKPKQPLPSIPKPKQFPPSDMKPRNLPPSDLKSRNVPPSGSGVKPRNVPPLDVKPRNFPPSDVKPRNFPPSDVKPRNFPPSDVKPRNFPPSDVKQKQFPPADVRRGPKALARKRRVIDSDDEYDSEVADFIDDGPDDGEDYSKHIREIFGYDRSKYRGVEGDDECMESSFSQQMKEEFKSTKLGIMEDLEDIRREKQREAMLKKKRKLK